MALSLESVIPEGHPRRHGQVVPRERGERVVLEERVQAAPAGSSNPDCWEREMGAGSEVATLATEGLRSPAVLAQVVESKRAAGLPPGLAEG